jgi:putative intracellular protease/amidase
MNDHSTGKPKALFVLSSATVLPLVEPALHPGISTGFFLVEMAQVLDEFQDDYEFVFATPDGKAPQLDINGLALSFHSTTRMGLVTMTSMMAQARKNFDADHHRRKYSALADRHDAELALAYRHLGRLPVSEILPNTDKEARLIRDEVVAMFDSLPSHEFASIEELVKRNSDTDDPFSLGEFTFVHMPGGHAPMVDFADNPWMGELLNVLHEEGVLISLICRAPVAMTSAKYRVLSDDRVVTDDHHPFRGVALTTVPTHGEKVALASAYPKVPGQRTRLEYYVDAALKAAGYQVKTTANPTAVRVIWQEHVKLLTGNGPQAVDAQTAKLREILGANQGTPRPAARR